MATVSDLLMLSSASAGNETTFAVTYANTPQPDVDTPNDQSHEEWLMPLIFGIIMLIGLVGNSLVIFVIVKASQRTVTNYYIVNLAVTDILFLVFCAPPTAAEYASSRGFLFGWFMCKFVQYLQNVTAQATCLFLTAMSMDRYQGIVRPLRSLRTRTFKVAVVISVVIWLGSLMLYLPLVFVFDIKYVDYGGVHPECLTNWPSVGMQKGFFFASILLEYVVPLTVICVCYGVIVCHLWKRVAPVDAPNGALAVHDANNAERIQRQKRKITWMVLAVVMVFAICWFPIHLFNLWRRLDINFPYTNHTLNLKTAGHVMSYANSCANPFIYAFLGENFRKSFRKAFACCFKKIEPVGGVIHVGPQTSRSQRGPQAAGPSRVAEAAPYDTQMSTLNTMNDK